jgi:hypothetical protein
MGFYRESPQEKAKRLAQRAISQVNNPQEKKKLAESLGYTLGTGKASGFLQGGLPTTRSKQTAERVVKAFESATTKHSNPRMAASGATQVDIAKFQENLGETPKEEYERKQAEAREYEQRPFREAEEAERQAREAAASLQRQQEEQAKIRREVEAGLAEAERKAQIAGKRSAATSARLRSQSMLEQAQVQQASVRTGLAAQAQQRKQPGTTVGQPGRTRTRVGSGLSIGGYGGTRATRVSPTGLNI